jgi:hypothetical protein
MSLSITLIGGPTALIEIDGFRLLTDPTFDQPGAYQLPHVKLEKLTGPAMSARDVSAIDAVLLSHDQHSDNLDHSEPHSAISRRFPVATDPFQALEFASKYLQVTLSQGGGYEEGSPLYLCYRPSGRWRTQYANCSYSICPKPHH